MEKLKTKNFRKFDSTIKKVYKKENIDDQVKMENIFNNILCFLDSDLENILKNISVEHKKVIEEIRLRLNKPLMIYMNGKDYFLDQKGKLKTNYNNTFFVNKESIINTYQKLCNYSIYAVEDEIRNGFITVKGGHRIGIAGRIVYGKNGIETIKEISSLNIRIAREKLDVSKKILPYLIKNNNIYHTLIVSPPQCGKTTLLRDLIRNFSNGIEELEFKGVKVGVVDERSEIASSYKGIAQNDIGLRTDILDACQKYDGIVILIRSMSPNIIATDELGGIKDIKAIHEALKAGVKIISTVHGENINDIKNKPNLKQIMEEKIFERIVILDNSKGVGTIKDIVDGKTFKSLLKGRNDVYIKNYGKFNDNNI
ncbi:MAG: stage III sporulation protein AA [Firmicutes bacterium]|nr:stage III sporulation protein AA [Bacillota bacterium]